MAFGQRRWSGQRDSFLFTPPMWVATIAIPRVVGRVWLSLLRPLFCFAVYVPKPAAFAASEPRAPFLVHVIPWRTSEILFKDFYHVLFDIFHGSAELHSFCQFFKNRHFSFLPSRRVEATSVGILEEYIGVEPTLSAWRAEVLTVIRILHKIAGEPSFSPAMMFV